MAVVETSFGKVEGLLADQVHGFLGIPFAAAPEGEKRWQPPEDPTSWSGVRAADDWGGHSWQTVLEGIGPLAFAFNSGLAVNRSEDCLHLNVWTPGLDARKRPVLVWIHGGGFSGGTGGTSMYDGTGLARRGDAVVVTLNYRLGALGFLNLNEVTGGRIAATGNEGLLDQVKALEWVQNNIERFGGDPSRVTIFGESAGGMSVGALLAFGPAKGLFHRAIPQSGAASTAQSLERAGEVAEAVLEVLGVSANADVDDFLKIDAEQLTVAAAAAGQKLGGMVFQPCVDGNMMREIPLDAVKGGAADDIAVLVGAARDEWKLFTAMPGFAVDLDEAALIAALSAHVPDPQPIIDAYRQARQARGQAAGPTDLFNAIETDRIFRMPAVHLAEAIAGRGGNAWQYLFTWESPWGDGNLGSPHAIDIGFVFATHAMDDGSAEFFGSGEAADQLAAHTQDAWLAFAADGNPRTEALSGWQTYDAQTRSTAIFDDPVAVESDPFGEERAAWDNVSAELGGL
jgi:para-nitrobenzyl esterase